MRVGRSTSRIPRGVVVMVGLAGLGPGCREELGPAHWATTRVSGTVREGTRPVGGGWIEFVPIDGTVGMLSSAPIQPDGTFVADGVAVGLNSVGLVAAPIELRGGRRAFDTLGTTIRRTIPPGPATTVVIEIYEEVARRNAELARLTETRR